MCRGMYPFYVEEKGFQFLALGPMLEACCHHKPEITETSLTSWGVVLDGQPSHEIWEGQHLFWNINCQEMKVVFLVLMCFLPDLRGYSVIV